MNIPVIIRAHHLLCMQGFQGYGYSDRFANHLKEIIACFRANPDMLIQAAIDCDQICSGCPHQMENRCNKDADADCRVKIMDSKILKCMGIKPDSIDRIQVMTERVNNTFISPEQLADICGDCQWTDKCTWYSSLKG